MDAGEARAVTAAQRWRTVLESEGFVRAIVAREFRAFARFSDDLVQQGLLSLYEALGRVRTVRMRWIFVRNDLWEYVDRFLLGERNQNRVTRVKVLRNSETLDAWGEGAVDRLAVEEDIVERVAGMELLERLEAALDAEEREVLSMLRLGYGQAEMAKATGRPVHWAYNRIKSIRKKAREMA